MWHMKIPYCSSSYFWFLVFAVFLLVLMSLLLISAAVVCHRLFFLTYSLRPSIDECCLSLPPSFLTHIVFLCHIQLKTPYTQSSIFLFFGKFVTVPSLSILTMIWVLANYQSLYDFDEIFATELFDKFSCSLEVILSVFFFRLCFMTLFAANILTYL